MQKVIVVNIYSRPEGNRHYSEYEFETLNKYLDQDYQVKQFHQIAPSEHQVTFTFILEQPQNVI